MGGQTAEAVEFDTGGIELGEATTVAIAELAGASAGKGTKPALARLDLQEKVVKAAIDDPAVPDLWAGAFWAYFRSMTGEPQTVEGALAQSAKTVEVASFLERNPISPVVVLHKHSNGIAFGRTTKETISVQPDYVSSFAPWLQVDKLGMELDPGFYIEKPWDFQEGDEPTLTSYPRGERYQLFPSREIYITDPAEFATAREAKGADETYIIGEAAVRAFFDKAVAEELSHIARVHREMPLAKRDLYQAVVLSTPFHLLTGLRAIKLDVETPGFAELVAKWTEAAVAQTAQLFERFGRELGILVGISWYRSYPQTAVLPGAPPTNIHALSWLRKQLGLNSRYRKNIFELPNSDAHEPHKHRAHASLMHGLWQEFVAIGAIQTKED